MTARLAAHGAKVVVADVDGGQATEHAQHFADRGADVLGVELDVAFRSVGRGRVLDASRPLRPAPTSS